jgi:hypothetical protein
LNEKKDEYAVRMIQCHVRGMLGRREANKQMLKQERAKMKAKQKQKQKQKNQLRGFEEGIGSNSSGSKDKTLPSLPKRVNSDGALPTGGVTHLPGRNEGPTNSYQKQNIVNIDDSPPIVKAMRRRPVTLVPAKTPQPKARPVNIHSSISPNVSAFIDVDDGDNDNGSIVTAASNASRIRPPTNRHQLKAQIRQKLQEEEGEEELEGEQRKSTRRRRKHNRFRRRIDGQIDKRSTIGIDGQVDWNFLGRRMLCYERKRKRQRRLFAEVGKGPESLCCCWQCQQ